MKTDINNAKTRLHRSGWVGVILFYMGVFLSIWLVIVYLYTKPLFDRRAELEAQKNAFLTSVGIDYKNLEKRDISIALAKLVKQDTAGTFQRKFADSYNNLARGLKDINDFIEKRPFLAITIQMYSFRSPIDAMDDSLKSVLYVFFPGIAYVLLLIILGAWLYLAAPRATNP